MTLLRSYKLLEIARKAFGILTIAYMMLNVFWLMPLAFMAALWPNYSNWMLLLSSLPF